MIIPTAPGDKRVVAYDIETFKNWFCVTVSNGVIHRTFSSSRGNIREMAGKLCNKNIALAGFNNVDYDDIIMRYILRNPDITPEEVNRLSARIIDPQDDDERDANFQDKYSPRQWGYSIDVFQILNGKGSLKEWACRGHARNVAETPYPFGEPLPNLTTAPLEVERYCVIDVVNTTKKLVELWEKVILREGLDKTFGLGDRVYGLTEQGLAQATFLKLHRDRSGQYAGEIREACQNHPDNKASEWALPAIISPKVSYATEPFRKFLAGLTKAKLGRLDANGSKWELRAPDLPISLVVNLAGARFQIGVGGLHSIDSPGSFVAGPESRIIDLDVTSYYPSIIINEGLFPGHIGPGFVSDMRTLRDRRVAAKRAGDKVTAEALKIVVNSTFGKLNDVWSPLRSVPNALRVTINGQLFLLMLIERLHHYRFKILSANTDGVTIQATDALLKSGDLEQVIRGWELATGFELERADYAVYARRDVNSYVAMTTGDKPKIKTKGAFQPDTGKGDGLIIKKAAVAFLTKGTPVSDTVRAAKLDELTFYQRCQNGGSLYHGDKHVGRLARWYVSVDGPSIRRKNPAGTWATIPNAHRASLVMDSDDVGTDIDITYYERQALALIESCKP